MSVMCCTIVARIVSRQVSCRCMRRCDQVEVNVNSVKYISKSTLHKLPDETCITNTCSLVIIWHWHTDDIMLTNSHNVLHMIERRWAKQRCCRLTPMAMESASWMRMS